MIGKFFRWLFREGEFRMPESPTNEHYESKYGRDERPYSQFLKETTDALNTQVAADESKYAGEGTVGTDTAPVSRALAKKQKAALTKTLKKTKVNGKPVVKKKIAKRK